MFKTYHNQYEKLEDRYRLIANNLIEALFVIDINTLKFDYITDSIEKISGFQADEYTNLTVQDRLVPDSYFQILKILDEAKTRYDRGVREAQTVEVELIHKNGSTYWAEIRAKILDKPKKPRKLLGVIKEITDRKKSEHLRKDLIKKLSETLAEKERLLKEIKVLRGLLPICSGCKRIRDESGNWWPLDVYIKQHTDADITHSICPDCSEIFQKL